MLPTAPALPRLYLITPQPGADDEAFIAGLAASLDRLASRGAGMPLVQLRAHGLTPARWRALALRVRRECHARSARLLLGAGALGPPPRGAVAELLAEALHDIGADGVHLPSAWLLAAGARPLPGDRLLAASCHDAAQLAQAGRIAADVVTLSPVLPTASHPGVPTLGWTRFACLCEGAGMPVYALGGVGPDQLPAALAAGAQGVAGIRALWAAGGAED